MNENPDTPVMEDLTAKLQREETNRQERAGALGFVEEGA